MFTRSFDYLQFPSWIIISVIVLSLASTIAVCMYILPNKKQSAYKGFIATLSSFFNYKHFWIPKIIKTLSAFATFTCIIGGIFTLFYSFIAGLLLIVLGPLLVRIIFEFTLLIYNIRDNIDKIANPNDFIKKNKEHSPYVNNATYNIEKDYNENRSHNGNNNFAGNYSINPNVTRSNLNNNNMGNREYNPERSPRRSR